MLIKTKVPAKSSSGNSSHEPYLSLGEMCRDVAASEIGRNLHSFPRLRAAAGGNEALPAEGGFLVEPEMAEDLLARVYDTGLIASRLQRVPLSKPTANGIKFFTSDESSRADGSRWGGVQGYWVNEASSVTATKPKFRRVELILNKLMATCYATDELLEDAAALDMVLKRAFAEEILFKVENSVVNGLGAGELRGIVTSEATIVVPKDTGDSGATISTNDVLAMFARFWAPSIQDGVWLVNSNVLPALFPLTVGSGTAAQFLYMQPSGGGRYGTMLGLPVLPCEYGAVLGTPGDIILADLSQYVVTDKGAPSAARSIHVNFLTDESVFRFVYRVDGEPVWNRPVTPKNGTNTQSPFVILAARS